MTAISLHKIRFQNGLWEGHLTAATPLSEPPAIKVVHQAQPIDGVEVAATSEAGTDWALSFAVPTTALNDGVQSFLICDATSDEKLGDFTLTAGEAQAGDLQAELDLLRSELDMLKRAFRRHCADSA